MFKNIKLLRELRKQSQYVEYDFDDFNSRNEAVIEMKAEKVEDLVSPFCIGDDLILTESFEKFLENSASPIEPHLAIDLKVNNAKNFSNEDRKAIKYAIKNHYTKKISLENDNLRRNMIDNIVLFIASIVVLALILVIEAVKFTTLIRQVLDILAWVLLWEVFDNFFLRRRVLRSAAIKNYQLLNMRVEFID